MSYLLLLVALASPNPRILYLVKSQFVEHEARLAEALKADLVKQGAVDVMLLHQHSHELNHIVRDNSGDWTYFPWIERLSRDAKENNGVGIDFDWFVFLEPRTVVDVRALESGLGALSHSEKLFLGRRLVDTTGSITRFMNSLKLAACVLCICLVPFDETMCVQ